MKIKTEEFKKLVYKTIPKEDFLSISLERCIGCKNCVTVCPSTLWSIKNGKAYLDRNYKRWCLECGACWQACKEDAILFDFPCGGTGIIVKYG